MERETEPYQVNILGTMKIIPYPARRHHLETRCNTPNSQPFICLPALALH